MKVPLRYQITNYDCGPTSLLNGLSVLFERHEIPPEIPQRLMLLCMDNFDEHGAAGRRGTTHAAMRYAADWLGRFADTGAIDLECRYLTGAEVTLAEGSGLRDALDRGGTAVAYIDLDGWHYILLTGVEGDTVYAFDPWILPEPFPVPDVKTDYDHPYSYNRVVPLSRFESTDIHPYSFGPYETREAVLMRRREK
ncbi:MAG: peptidase C39 [Oscillospiraceae bacterium]|nr:peptidase C39 [Oscillospiraceae bacterium]